MGAIQKYMALCNDSIARQPVPLKTPEQIFKGKPILNDAVTVTLAEYDVDTKDAITAHHLKDYRRKRFNLMLLPKFHTIFDSILEGSEYWNGLLHNEGPYT